MSLLSVSEVSIWISPSVFPPCFLGRLRSWESKQVRFLSYTPTYPKMIFKFQSNKRMEEAAYFAGECMVTTTSYKLKQCAWSEISESNLSWYGVFLRFKHSDNLTHLWSLVGIWVNTPQSCQKGSFKGTCRGPGLNGWVNHFFRAPAANHHFEPVDQIYLQDLTNSKNQEEYFYDDIMTYM